MSNKNQTPPKNCCSCGNPWDNVGNKGDKGDKGDVGPIGPQGARGAQGSSGTQGAPGEGTDIDWDEIEDQIDDRVDEKIQDIIDMIEDGELSAVDKNQLRAIVDGIIKDHARILQLISLYQLPESLSVPYNDSYVALLQYLDPYINGSKTIVDNPVEFTQKFNDYYTAKANIEMESMIRSHANEEQAQVTAELLNSITNFWGVQIYEEEGVIIAGTMAVGTPNYNNAGITGVTDQGSSSVRIYSGASYANRYSAPFRVLDDGRAWFGGNDWGMDIGISNEDTITFRSAIFMDSGGNRSEVGVRRAPYEAGEVYYRGNEVPHNGSLWQYINILPGNGGVPSEFNTNWEIIISGGTGVFRSSVFARAETQPPTPTGGSFADPFPTDPIWHDTDPGGPGLVWQTTRLFTQNGAPPQESAWKLPYNPVDTETEEHRWCYIETNDYAQVGTPTTNPENWSGDSIGAVWKAERYMTFGSWGAWSVYRVKGETGAAGPQGADGAPGDNGADGADGADGVDGYYTEYRYAVNGSWSAWPDPPSPADRDPAGWTVEVPSYDPNALEYLWSISALIDPTNNTLVNLWNLPPIRLSGVPGADGDGSTTFPSFVFRASATNIQNEANRPTGGTVDSPIPVGGLWSLDIPLSSPTTAVFVSRRTFSTDPERQEAEWDIPRVYTDSNKEQFRYSAATGSNPGYPPNGEEGIGNGWFESFDGISARWLATRIKTAAVTGTWSAWTINKLQGADGPQGSQGAQGASGAQGANGAPGSTPPIVVYMDDYDPSAIYQGNPQVITGVSYGSPSRVYYSRVDAPGGSFSGIVPTNTGYWTISEIQAESLFAKVAAFTTATIKTLTVDKFLAKDVLPSRATKAINVIPTDMGGHFDPTSSLTTFKLFGEREYYETGRIAYYRGIVSNYTFTAPAGTITLNGFVQIVWKDEAGSPVFYFVDSTTSDGGFQYVDGSSSSVLPIENYRVISTSLTSSATDAQLKSIMWATTPNIPRELDLSYFCGVYPYVFRTLMIGVTNSGPTIYAKSETGQPVRYYTTVGATSFVVNGWYSLNGDISGSSIQALDFQMTFSLTVTLVYISNGVVASTKVLTEESVVYGSGGIGTPISSCSVGNPTILVEEIT